MGVEVEGEEVFRFGTIIGSGAGRAAPKDVGGPPDPDETDHTLNIIPVAVIERRLDNSFVGEAIVVPRPPDEIRSFFDEFLQFHASRIPKIPFGNKCFLIQINL